MSSWSSWLPWSSWSPISSWLSGHHGRNGHHGFHGHDYHFSHGCHAMPIMTVMVIMVIMVIWIYTKRQTGQTDLAFKLDFPGNLCRVVFAILKMLTPIIVPKTLLFSSQRRVMRETEIHSLLREARLLEATQLWVSKEICQRKFHAFKIDVKCHIFS